MKFFLIALTTLSLGQAFACDLEEANRNAREDLTKVLNHYRGELKLDTVTEDQILNPNRTFETLEQLGDAIWISEHVVEANKKFDSPVYGHKGTWPAVGMGLNYMIYRGIKGKFKKQDSLTKRFCR